jgi:hypothetical protein
MNKRCFSILLFCSLHVTLRAQQVLPGITVKDMGGKILVSWKNEYNLPLKTINIQRSYDSLKKYSTIGSVLNPQNKENGFADANAPYNKMYYRVFIAFEGGTYIISEAVRPSKDSSATNFLSTIKYSWQIDPSLVDIKKTVPKEDNTAAKQPDLPNTQIFKMPPWTIINPSISINPSIFSPQTAIPNPTINTPKPIVPATVPVPATPVYTYPSKSIYTSKDNNVVLHLPQASLKKYKIVFYNELEQPLFELSNIKEEYLIIEKVNFVRAGWILFDLFENDKLIEKNKFFIPKDGKPNLESLKKGMNK